MRSLWFTCTSRALSHADRLSCGRPSAVRGLRPVLKEAAAGPAKTIDEQVQASAEVAWAVAALSASTMPSYRRSGEQVVANLPSGDELGAEFERFLAQSRPRRSDDDLTLTPRKRPQNGLSRPDNKIGEDDRAEAKSSPRRGTAYAAVPHRPRLSAAFRIAGSGPAILLIHGIGDNSTTWNGVHAKLAQRFTVIARESTGPQSGQAACRLPGCGLRHLCGPPQRLDIERVTIRAIRSAAG